MSDSVNPYSSPQTQIDNPEYQEEIPVSGGQLGAVASLAMTSRILLYIYGVCSAAIVVLCIWVGSQYDKGIDPLFNEQGDIQLLGSCYNGFTGAQNLAFWIHVIVFCILVFRITKNAAIIRGYTDYEIITPGWAVGFYFFPILWLWKPYVAMKQTWQTTLGADTPHKIVLTWWWIWIVSGPIEAIAAAADESTLNATLDTSNAYPHGEYLLAFSYAVNIATALLLSEVVRRIAKKQHSMYQQQLIQGQPAPTSP